MNQRLSYSLTSLTPPQINSQFLTTKQHFNLLYVQSTSKPEHFILKNMAHITLKRLFYLKEGIRDEEVRSALTSIVFKPIPILAHELYIFHSPKQGNVLVIKVEKSLELQKLHDDLSSLIDTSSDEEDTTFEKQKYNPHLSVLYRLPEKQIEEAKIYVEKHILPVSYTLSSFLLMRDVPEVVGERELVKEYFAKL